MYKMAITKIWKVKDRLDFTINYAINGEKDTRHDKNHRSGSAARQGGH